MTEETTEETSTLQFSSADERIAWDRFVAATLAGEQYRGAPVAVRIADMLILERRKRGGPPNESVDNRDAGGWNSARNLDGLRIAAERGDR
jgi:hypothetical protein